MARYYSVILAINVFIGLFYYFIKRNSGITPKIFLSISAVSVFVGAIFPVVLGFSSLVMAIVANLLLIGIGAYYITVLLGDKGSDSGVLENVPEPIEILIPVEQQETASNRLTPEEPTEEYAAVGILEETAIAAEAEITEEEAVAEEVVEEVVEESVEEITAAEEAVEEEIIEETAEETAIGEEAAEAEFIEEEAVAEESVEESVEETIAAEEAVAEEVVEEVVEESVEEITAAEEAVEEEIIEETAEETAIAEEAAEAEFTEEEVVAEAEEPRIPWEAEALNDLQGVENMSVVNNLSIEDPFELRDSYIMRGFDAKTEGKLELAVKYFSSALELNPPSDLEFMLIFDICAMLKELGQYRRAQENLEQYKNDRPDLSGEILHEVIILQKTLVLLQETLTKANTPNLPFSKVPALIRVSVEEKVNQWKNEGF